MPLPDLPSGPTPGMAAGSHSPGVRRRADKSRAGSWTGRPGASRLARRLPPGQVARAQDLGGNRAAAEFGSRPATSRGRLGEAIGRDGRRSKATTLTDSAQLPMLGQGLGCCSLTGTVGQCPRNTKDGLGRSCGKCQQ